MKQAFINNIKSLAKFGDGICLARVDEAIDGLGLRSYLQNTPKVVITGTNGKGSVAALLHDILNEAGLICALFTSPHFFEFNERFKVAGNNIEYGVLNNAFNQVHAQIKTIEGQKQEKFGVFEVLFLVALKSFKTLGADFLVFEAGIGGRYDPVRLMQSSLTALTSVDLEHCDILGATKELIAYDKLDACQNGGTTVVGGLDDDLIDKINVYCKLRNVSTVFNSQIGIEQGAQHTLTITLPDKGKFSCQTPLFGEFAMENIKTALSLAENILPSSDEKFCVYQRALTHHVNPGRLSYMSEAPNVLLDSAHTNESYRLLFTSLKQRYQTHRPVFLVGVSQGRELDELISGLEQVANSCIVSQAKMRGAAPEILGEKLLEAGVSCQVIPDLSKAVRQAREMAESLSTDLVVCGGLFFAGEVATLIKGTTDEELFLF